VHWSTIHETSSPSIDEPVPPITGCIYRDGFMDLL
jgi:hypothetical protein